MLSRKDKQRKSLWQNFDFIFLSSVICLILMGFALIYSSDNSLETQVHLNRQIVVVCIGLVIGAIFVALPLKFCYAVSYIVFTISIVVLIAVIFAGTIGYGAKRWLLIGGFRFQPSELTKIAFIFAIARFLSDRRYSFSDAKALTSVILMTIPVLFLILLQPDLGTASVFPIIALSMLLWFGIPFKYLVIMILPFISLFIAVLPLLIGTIVLGGIVYLFRSGYKGIRIIVIALICITAMWSAPVAWDHLEDYQKRRLTTFLDPSKDPTGAGYQIIQSKTAIGAGGLMGTGLTKGSQTQLRFLPHHHTDFIFSLAGEELGFLGATFIIFLYFVFGWRGYLIANKQRSSFTSLCVAGLTSMILYHSIVNISMTLGLLPVTGLPLPFISYGGTFMIVCITTVGIILSASINRRKV